MKKLTVSIYLPMVIAFTIFQVQQVNAQDSQLPSSGKSAMDCPENSLYSNPLSENSFVDFWEGRHIMATSYSVDGSIDTVVFWGITAEIWGGDPQWYDCSSANPLIFDLFFYEKEGNEIGAEYYSYPTIEAIAEYTGGDFEGFTIKRYTIVLKTPCNLSKGFVGISLAVPYYGICYFLWVNSPTGTGSAYQASNKQGPWLEADFPFSICLQGKPNPCLAPVNLSYSNNTVSTANLAWTELNTASKWQVELSSLGTTQISSTIIDTDVNPITIDGLNAESIYKFSTRSVCAESDTSQWSIPLKFKTTCIGVTDYPFTENFDGDWETWCWKVIDADADGFTWNKNHRWITPLSGEYTAQGEGNFDDYLISPKLVLDRIYEFSWWDKVQSSEFKNKYEILVSTTGTNPADFTTNLGTFDCSNMDWVKHRVYLDEFEGQSIYIAIHQIYSASMMYGFGIEDATIDVKSDCLPVNYLSASNIATTSTELSWVEMGDATAWNIEYGFKGFILGQGTHINVAENPYTLNGLFDGNEYQFYVQADCGNEISEWVGPYTFKTLCAIGTDISESFEEKVPPTCWNTFADGYGVYAWSQTDWIAYQGNYSATVSSYYDKDRGLGWLITRKTTIPVGKALSFYVYVEQSSTNETWLSIKISTDESSDNLEAFVDLLTIHGADISPEKFTQYAIDLSAYEGQEVYLAFVMLNSYVNRWFLDDVTFITCPYPANLVAKNITTTSAELSWESNASKFAVEYGAYGFTLGEGINDYVSTPSYVITDLEPSHNYHFYVKSYCSDQDSSSWAGPFIFTTSNLPCVDIVEFPYFEGFEIHYEFTCWTPMYNTANDGGLNGTNLITPPSDNRWLIITPESLNHNGDYYIYEGFRAAYIDKSAPNFNWLISPNIMVPNGGGNLTFRYFYYNYVWANWITKFYINIFHDNVWTTALTCDENTPTNLYNELVEFDLSEYSSQPIKIAFVYEHSNGYEMAVDNITINGITVLNTETDILMYSIAGETEAATINPANHTIDVSVAGGTDVNALVASFTLSEGAIVKVSDIVQVSGQTVNNFNNHPVIYQVIAQDGVTIQNWTVTVTPTGIGDNWANTVKIYPNPTTGKFFIEGVYGEKTTMKILDISGRLVTTIEIKSNQQMIDLTTFTKGIYLLQLQSAEGVETQKLVVQ